MFLFLSFAFRTIFSMKFLFEYNMCSWLNDWMDAHSCELDFRMHFSTHELLLLFTFLGLEKKREDHFIFTPALLSFFVPKSPISMIQLYILAVLWWVSCTIRSFHRYSAAHSIQYSHIFSLNIFLSSSIWFETIDNFLVKNTKFQAIKSHQFSLWIGCACSFCFVILSQIVIHFSAFQFHFSVHVDRGPTGTHTRSYHSSKIKSNRSSIFRYSPIFARITWFTAASVKLWKRIMGISCFFLFG